MSAAPLKFPASTEPTCTNTKLRNVSPNIRGTFSSVWRPRPLKPLTRITAVRALRSRTAGSAGGLLDSISAASTIASRRLSWTPTPA